MDQMDEAQMEKYADYLDNLEKTDPEGYIKLIQQLNPNAAAMAAATGAPPPAAAATTSGIQFPGKGNKVMGKDGLESTPEGEWIDVEPGFVMKTKDVMTDQKIFVNFCQSPKIKNFSEKKQLDKDGQEQEGMHIPLSVGVAHSTLDKKKVECVAYDVAVNPQVLEDCKTDTNGTFRNFLCQLAIEFLEQKYKVKLDPKYKLPRSSYQGTLPPPKHHVRKEKAPVIQEITTPKVKRKASNTIVKELKRPEKKVVTMFYLRNDDEDRIECERTSCVTTGCIPLSPELLQEAPTYLELQVKVPTGVELSGSNNIRLAVGPEHLELAVANCFPVDLFLPYPVLVNDDAIQCTVDLQARVILARMRIDKKWSHNGPDPGSNPWLLSQALQDDEELASSTKDKTAECPATVHDRFHLDRKSTSKATTTTTTADNVYDAVHEDDVLPEDKFHAKDSMSHMILQQRKQDHEKKQKEADEARVIKRREYNEKVAKAEAAGKTWQEMYPDEPEMNFIDVEDIMGKKKDEKVEVPEEISVASDAAIATAEAWSKKLESSSSLPSLSSSLAFDLLD